jgi:hypothetical protein
MLATLRRIRRGAGAPRAPGRSRQRRLRRAATRTVGARCVPKSAGSRMALSAMLRAEQLSRRTSFHPGRRLAGGPVAASYFAATALAVDGLRRLDPPFGPARGQGDLPSRAW